MMPDHLQLSESAESHSSMTFPDFFEVAHGAPKGERTPYSYQRRLACGEKGGRESGEWLASGTPCESRLISIPTGLGKTAAVVLAWLWNRVVQPDTEARKAWPRRLVYCLPMRTLVEQTRDEAERWLKAHGLLWDGKGPHEGKVGLHILMGGEDAGEWDIHPEREAILIGTQDMLLSRALNRGYGMSRYRWPMHFGLLNNDCLWVFDEVQLMGAGLPTTAQLAAFRARLECGSPTHSWWMSATSELDWLRTVDFDPATLPDAIKLEEADLEAVKGIREAQKTVSRCEKTSKDAKALATEILDTIKERDGLTLVVVNTVKFARSLYSEINKQRKDAPKDERPILLHSQFRPEDRAGQLKKVTEGEGKRRLVISTQIIEAGVDLSAATLFTEVAPWSSLVQRFGRCNRRGTEPGARIFLITPEKALPYTDEQLTAANAEIDKLIASTTNASPASLSVVPIPAVDRPPSRHVIRRRDFIDLFDTTPDLAGQDIDIDRWVREIEDRSVQLFWRTWDGAKGARPPSTDFPQPHRQELCPAPIGAVKEWLKKKKLTPWRWDYLESEWAKVQKDMNEFSIVPGQIYLLASEAGGYSTETGFDTSIPSGVAPLSTAAGDTDDGNEQDQTSGGNWQSIAQHTDDVCGELKAILKATGVVCPALPIAARWHDLGKAHEAFQSKIKLDHRLSPDGKAHTPIAKAPDGAWKHHRERDAEDETLRRRRHFRHELASALAVLQATIGDIPEELRNLVAWLIAAHHGKVRLSIRSMPAEAVPSGEKRFARGVWDGDLLPEVPLGGGILSSAFTLSLEPMELGLCIEKPFENQPSWAERMLALRDSPELGPLRLAYWETLLRAADERASAKNHTTIIQ
jgi:CRISPR-associated endonuclease/helicase Cas3